ncbi:toll/interleukin-1 receptor domain-containing protein [Emcibacter sp. SYSU 3D8]|uniref:toll/interleukin-1 receptor domain-containing protein n=1 Tax=Emcibacter sp. SYSU 3D8 TaxID=3133969 RepID=UPI0031FEF3DA
MAGAADIFISYASEDRGEAEKLARRLESFGWTTWWDRRIPPGQDYAKVIENALVGARCVIVLWSKDSAASRWVVNEAGAAADRGVLVPALIAQTDIPFEFRRIQAADLIGWDPSVQSESFNQLVDAVAGILKTPRPAPQPMPTPTPRPPPPPPAAKSNKRLWLLMGAGFSLLCAFAGCADVMSTGDEDTLMGALFLLGLSVCLFVMGLRAK